jgi:hypothetical protein
MATGSLPSQLALWKSKDTLLQFDVVELSCEGDENGSTKPQESLQAMQDYANAGGRVFASHFHYYWLSHGPPPFPSTAAWTPGADPASTSNGAIDTSFPKGVAFDKWLKNVNAVQADGTLDLRDTRANAAVDVNVNKGSRPWITAGAATMYFSFNTPLTAPEDQQCGRVIFSGLHVGAASQDYSRKGTPGNDAVPTGCTIGDLSPQEKALEFMLFDLTTCVVPDSVPPAPPPTPPR